MALFGWLKNNTPSGDQPPFFRLEWSGLASAPFDGDQHRITWADTHALLQRFFAEPATSDAYFILGVTEQTYLQAAWDNSTITLEYQAGSTDHHFTCDQPVSPDLLLELARLYMDNPASIADLASWEPMDL